jgi:hypothetical protein
MAREKERDRGQSLGRFADPTQNLRTAKSFLADLIEEQARGFGARPERLKRYFGACINAANGAIEARKNQVGRKKFRDLDDDWRQSVQDADALALFDRLHDLRIEDFHYGVLHAPVGQKWVNAQWLPSLSVFSSPGAFVEKTNPSGETLRGAALASVPTLYVEYEGGQLEATEACRRFIALIENLVARALPSVGGITA